MALPLALKLSAPPRPGSIFSNESLPPQNGTYPAVLPLDVDEAAMMFVTPDFYALNASLHWASLIPCGHGWVRLGEAREPFAVSMYHQIHCLNGIRSALLSPPSERTPHGDGHMNHCFNYLRQLLVCRADTTLEPTQIIRKDGKVFAAASGEGVVHKCRDWTQIRRFVEDNMLHARSE
ncbi:hypothetical protein MKEN_00967500 [Mycena kentingensis (nom. inval.)]|nr:hypothetical protein MKEN_00967500 [Mycena kentingensis (nom. inval.)]